MNLRDSTSAALRGAGTWRGGALALTRVFVYDAVSENKETDAPSDVENWLSRNDELIDVHVRRGHLAGDRRSANRRRQKGVDVQLAVDALSGAFNATFDVALLVAGDADFAPVVEAIRDRGPW